MFLNFIFIIGIIKIDIIVVVVVSSSQFAWFYRLKQDGSSGI
jgi:hypothetical protein